VRRSSRALRTLVRTLALSPGEWVRIAAAEAALVRAQIRMGTRPKGALVDHAAPEPAGGVLPDALRSELELADNLGLDVLRAARLNPFRPQCLARSLALADLLDRHGLHGARIRVGVATGAEGFRAHAWVEYRGRVVGDRDESVGTFSAFSDVAPRGTA
jgi:hypothetical protein